MTIDQPADRDPFALGGRTGETAGSSVELTQRERSLAQQAAEFLKTNFPNVTAADVQRAADLLADGKLTSVAAAPAGDDVLFALIAETNALEDEHGRLHEEAENLEEEVLSALPKAEIEYGFSINRKGERTSFVAKTADEISRSLTRPRGDDVLALAERTLGLRHEFYYDRHDDLVAELASRKAAIDSALAAPGVADAIKRRDGCLELIDANLEKALVFFPETLAGADAIRDFGDVYDREDLVDHAVGCYRRLAGARPGDELVLSLFRQWIEAAQAFDRDQSEAQRDAADARWGEIEDQIEAATGGAVALAVKGFILIRRELPGEVCPLPYLRLGSGENPALEIGFLREAAALVPEIAELASAIIHEDAVLIDAEMDVDWATTVLAGDLSHWDHLENGAARREEWRGGVNDKLSKALHSIASTEARTERGAAIKARHAAGGAA